MTSDAADAIVDGVTQRRGQIGLRLVLAGCVMVTYFPRVGIAFIVIWGLAYSAVQGVEYAFFRPGLIAERLARPGGKAAAFVLVAVSNLIYGAFAVELAMGGGVGIACSALMTASVAFNSVLTLQRYTPLMWAGLAPTLAAAVFLPLGGLKMDGSLHNAGLLCIAIALCLGGLNQAFAMGRRLSNLQQEAQRATEEAAFAKGRFVANISHELRTPLNGVIAAASLLEKSDLSERDRELVGHLTFASHNLKALIGDILDASKADAGQLEFASEPFCPSETVRRAAELHRASAEAKDLIFDVQVLGDPLWAMGDALRVGQIIGNLTNNAIKFTGKGTVTVTITTEAVADEAHVTVNVSDSGIGMTPETAAEIFKPFVQADVSITREFGGTGLGLSICRILADGMNASLTVASEQGHGSTFTLGLTLPLAEPTQLVETHDRPDDPVFAHQARLRILVVDDHPANRRLMELILEAEHDIVSADNGREALDLLTHTSFDLIITDMQMPIMDGPSLVAALRRLEAAQGRPRTPTILATADAAMTLVSARGMGADGVVTKPFTAEILMTAVDLYRPDARIEMNLFAA